MKQKIVASLISAALLVFLTSCGLFENDSGNTENEDIWVNAYLVSWQHNPETELINSGKIRTSDIDWDAMTHMTYFALNIAGSGVPSLSLDPNLRHNFNADRLRAIVPAAHAHDTKILFSVGGGGNYEGFSTAIDTSRTELIQTISDIITEYGFDGVSLNMTPILPEDYSNYRLFVQQLSSRFDTLQTKQNKRPLLTAGVSNTSGISSLYADIHQHFDQLNILSFEMARPWRGWVTWHQSPMSHNNIMLENTSQFLPSINERVSEWVSAGVDRIKIGYTISFYGAVWNDVHLLEKWDSWPTENQSIYSTLPVSSIYGNYDLSRAQWDDKARASYLHVEDPKTFISFENHRSVTVKIEYAKKNRLGGVMIWELSGGFYDDGTPVHSLFDSLRPHVHK